MREIKKSHLSFHYGSLLKIQYLRRLARSEKSTILANKDCAEEFELIAFCYPVKVTPLVTEPHPNVLDIFRDAYVLEF